MSWFRVSAKRLDYRGRVSKRPYSAWAASPEGSAAIEERARADRLRLFGHSRARRRMWRELGAVVRGQAFHAAMLSTAKHFAKAMSDASYAPALPRRTVALHRLVVVPRAFVAGRMRSALRAELRNEALAGLDAPVREFFLEQLIVELDAAVAAHRPSTSRPVLTQDGWACVGYYNECDWIDPVFSGPGWSGHLLMFEFPAERLSRRAGKELVQAVGDIQASLASLSRLQRQAIAQMAADDLARATA